MNIQKKATIISSFIAFFLAVLKLIVWFFSNSIAILSSAIDSILDMFVSLFNLFAVSSAEKNPDKVFNYWRWKIEALASFLEGIIISFSWAYIFYEAINKIIHKWRITDIWIWVFVMIFSVIVTFFLVFYLTKVLEKTKNLVIKSDALHYKTDLLSNSAVLIWLIFIYFTEFYLVDAILWIIIAYYIVFSAFEIMKQWYFLLLDISLDKEEVDRIKEIISQSKKIKDFHNLKTRQSWWVKFVEAHLVFEEDILLYKAHNVSHKIENKIKNLDKSSKWWITFHLDPYDDSEEDFKNF